MIHSDQSQEEMEMDVRTHHAGKFTSQQLFFRGIVSMWTP